MNQHAQVHTLLPLSSCSRIVTLSSLAFSKAQLRTCCFDQIHRWRVQHWIWHHSRNVCSFSTHVVFQFRLGNKGHWTCLLFVCFTPLTLGVSSKKSESTRNGSKQSFKLFNVHAWKSALCYSIQKMYPYFISVPLKAASPLQPTSFLPCKNCGIRIATSLQPIYQKRLIRVVWKVIRICPALPCFRVYFSE